MIMQAKNPPLSYIFLLGKVIRFVSALLALGAVAFGLTACGGGGGGSDGSTGNDDSKKPGSNSSAVADYAPETGHFYGVKLESYNQWFTMYANGSAATRSSGMNLGTMGGYWSYRKTGANKGQIHFTNMTCELGYGVWMKFNYSGEITFESATKCYIYGTYSSSTSSGRNNSGTWSGSYKITKL